MNIIINGYFLTRPFTGFGNYTIGLLQGLQKVDSRNRYFVLVPHAVSFKPTAKNIEILVVPEKKWLGASGAKFYWEQKQVPAEARKLNASLIHQLYPATASYCKIPQIVSIHDATPWHFSEHNDSGKIRHYREFTRKNAKKAELIVTVSNYAKQDVAAVFHIPKEKIHVIYNGVNEIFRQPVAKPRAAHVLAKYNINKPYIFYLGGYEFHKNVRRMFFAYAKIVSELDENLVLAGGVFSKSRQSVYKDWFELPKLIENYKLQNRIHLIGPIKAEDLPAVYQSASLFISPSLAEGFNIPVVEAFASKVPVVCSNTTATKEIAQEAAYLFDPQNEAAMGRAMLKVLNDKQLRQTLVSAGHERQKQFSWEKAAKELVALYQRFET